MFVWVEAVKSFRLSLWLGVALFAARDLVILQLGAQHRFLYAGYYMALARGYYQEENLDVAFRLWDSTTSAVDAVILGKANFGTENSRIIQAWSEGKPVVSLAVVLQRSPASIITQSHITVPGQLKRGRVAITPEWDLDLRAMLALNGISGDSLEPLPATDAGSTRYAGLRRGDYLGIAGDMTLDPIRIPGTGIDYNVLPAYRYGAELYGSCLFTSRYEVEMHPERVLRFIRASVKGWEYALLHIQETLDHILKHYDVAYDREQLLFEAKAIADLNRGVRVSVGEQDRALWQRDADLLAELKLIPPTDVNAYVFRPERLEKELRAKSLRQLSLLAGVAFILALIFSGLSLWFWIGMRRRNRVLRENERRLQQALSATMDAVWDWSDVGSRMWWSPVGDELLQIDSRDLRPRWALFLDKVHPQDRALIQEDFTRAMHERGSVYRDLRVMVGSSYRWIRVRGAYRSDEGKGLLSGVFQDVHELIETERARRESETQFREYFELGLVGMASLNAEGRFVQVNKTLCEMLESSEAQVLQATWAQYTHGRDVPLEMDLMESVRRGERSGYNLDKRFISLSGKVIYALVSVRGVPPADGDLRGMRWVMLVQDISRRREGEQEKEKILHQLSLKNKTLEMMLQTIGHDFRTPLVNVLWYIQEVLKELAAGQYAAAEQSARNVLRGAETLDQMLNSILSLSRLGRPATDVKILDMNRLVRAVLDELHAEIVHCDAVVETADLPKVQGSESLIYQVWKHLLSNALQAKDSQRPLRITLAGRQIRDWNIYTVADTGIGIPKASLGHIFAPFFKLGAAEKEERAGMGLAYVTRILENHRGHITVESELGKGTMFSFYLPGI